MTGAVMVTQGCRGREAGVKGAKQGDDDQQHISLVTLLLAAIRRSVVPCRIHRSDGVVAALRQMEIGWPTNVCHVSHVTFDRFDGFLGLPVEFELEIPGRVPSASANVFGVSAELMQCSYDSKGNSVPTILLLMQDRLYSQGGLKAEGIFRINPENSQEECVRDQLNEGIVPDDIDVHCLAGLIKAWFRELPSGVLDGLSPEQVLQCNTEEESVELVALLLPTQAALLNWAVELMSDVVEEVDFNKMNARNIAMVFAPNMTQMADPLTALMHTVQVMNLLKTLILKTIRERKEIVIGFSSPSSGERTDDDFDSQIEDVGFELIETTSEDEHFDYTHYTRDESESKNAIVECFSRQLDGRKELTNDVEHEELVENLGRDQERIWGSSDSITMSAFSISDSKNGSSISSSIMNEGEDLVTSVTMESESRQLTDSLVS